MRRIPVAGPWITPKEIEYVSDAVARAWYEDANIYHERFERAFAAHVGVRHAVALPSCTSAIHLVLAALGIGPGDEVVVPEITWIASAAPVSYLGARPVFADVEPSTWCLSPASFESLISRRTRAVIPVDLYGCVADVHAIRDIAAQHGIAVIEDAAQAVGSTCRGRVAGSLGDVGVFSFHGSKTLTTGEGGMLVTDRSDLYERVLTLRDHGRSRSAAKLFWNDEVAYKYRMSSMQAALGLAQLERLEELVARKREIFRWYQEALAGLDSLSLNPEPPDVRNSYWMVTALLDTNLGLTKEEAMKRLAAHGIDARPFFYPLSSLPAYDAYPEAHLARSANRVAYRLSPYGVNLPSALNLTRDTVQYVCDVLASLVKTGHDETRARPEALIRKALP